MGTFYNPKFNVNGIQFYLDAANKKSYPGTGNTWYDISGNGRHGTKAGSVGPTWNSAGYFNFTGGTAGNPYSYFYITSPTMTQLTAEAWVRATDGTVFRTNSDSYSIGTTGLARFCAGTAYNDIASYWAVASDLYNSTWMHVAITWDGQTLQTFKNGVLKTTNTRGSSLASLASGYLYVGTRSDAYLEHYVGDIALVCVRNVVLTADQLAQNFNAFRGRFGV